MHNKMKNYSVVATKVPLEYKARLESIANKLGLNKYELFQGLLLALLRFFDDGASLSSNHYAMINVFADVLKSSKESFRPLQIHERSVKGAILFIEETPDKMPQVLYVGKDGNGHLSESMNYDKMLSEFLKSMDKNVFERLDAIKNQFEYISIAHALRDLVMLSNQEKETISSEVEELFQDIRIPSGQAINNEVHYKGRWRQNVKEYTTIVKDKVYRADL